MSCRGFESAFPGVKRLRSIWMYLGSAPELLGRYKESGDLDIANFFATSLSRALDSWGDEFDLLMSIPSSPANTKKRGFKTMERVSSLLAPCYKTKYKANFLRRGLGLSQKALNKQERINNAAHMFLPAKKLPDKSTILLLDDVCTTGATLSAAGLELLKAGADQVFAITLFRD